MNRVLQLLILAVFFHITPVLAGPITSADTVTVNGIEWAQPTLFTSLSWQDINSVCDASTAGSCQPGGMLNTWDMAGWVWASVEDVNNLFNFYLQEGGVPPEDQLVGPSSIHEMFLNHDDTAWALAFFEDGFRSNLNDGLGPNLEGLTRSSAGPGLVYEAGAAHTLFLSPPYGYYDDVFGTGLAVPDTKVVSWVGAFFYRAPSVAVPIPSTLFLLALGVGGLFIRREYQPLLRA